MILQKTSSNRFNLQDLSFSDLITIKKACAAFASQGSQAAAQLEEQLEQALDSTTI